MSFEDDWRDMCVVFAPSFWKRVQAAWSMLVYGHMGVPLKYLTTRDQFLKEMERKRK